MIIDDIIKILFLLVGLLVFGAVMGCFIFDLFDSYRDSPKRDEGWDD